MYKLYFIYVCLSNQYSSLTEPNIKKVVKYLIDNGDIPNLKSLLPLGFLTKKNVVELISYANEKKQYEMQVMIDNYRVENIGDIKDSCRL